MFPEHEAMRQKFRRKQVLGRWIRAGGARRKLLTFLALVFGAVALLPLIVAKTSLRNTLLSKAVPGGAVQITAAGASLSWIRGPSLSDIEVVDATGGRLMAAQRISIDRAPGSLLLNSHDLGVIEIARPTIYLKVRPDGSNLEDALEAIVKALSPEAATSADSGAATPTAFAINIVEGTIMIDDVATSQQWRIEGVNVQYDNRGAMGGFGRGVLAGQIVRLPHAESPVSAGGFSVSWQPALEGRNQMALQVEGVSLSIVEPWARRFAGASELGGTLSGQGTATWSNPASGSVPSDLVTSGTLAIDRLDATAPAWQGDRIKLMRVELPWQVTSQQGGWTIENLQVRCDVGQVAVRGRVDSNLTAAQHNLELRGAIDVARLAAMLPHAMRIREGTSITSGTIELAGQYQPHEGGQLITGSVRTAQLAGTNAGRAVRWDQPVNANFALRRATGVLQLDSLRCDSQFLKIDAAGSPQQFAASASFDLNILSEQLGQFMDLSGMKLAGTGSAKLAWQQAGAEQFSATASGDLAQLAVSLGDGGMWAEPQLAIRAEVAGVLDPSMNRPTRVDVAKLQVNGQGDLLDAQLTSAVGLTDAAPAFPVTIKASGRIARWLTRVRPWFAPDPWQVDGQSELNAVVRVAPNAFEVTSTKLTVTDLRATAPGWNIHEPRVEFAGNARWDGATNEATAGSAQLVTSTVSLATKDVRYRAGDAAINQLTGAAAFRADLARLAAWRAPANQPAPYQAKGELTGNLRFAQQGDRITGELNATGQNLALASYSAAASPSNVTPASRGVPAPAGYQTIWQDPNLTLRGVANYQPSADRLSFDKLQIQSNTLQASATGTVDKLSTATDVNATGTLNYDLAQVTPLLRPYIGNGVQLTGKEQARFAMAGKLSDEGGPRAQLTNVSTNDPYRLATSTSAAPAVHWSRRVRAQLELPWSGANLYGLPVGAGRLAATLGDGAIRVEPLSLAVGEGQLTAAPHVRFDPEPAELTMPPGPLITNVRISPEVSEAMLKYVAPVLAGSTQSEGQFSMQLDGTRVPLADTKKADVAGKLSVHSVRVVPGAMANELIGVAKQIEAIARRRDTSPNPSPSWGGVGGGASKPQVTLLNIRDQQVNFKVIEGRVHHQNMEFQVGDITMRSQGSVGFDQTVQLTLQVPIQDAWVDKEPLLTGFKGQSLQIPVGGTLTHPKMDPRAIAGLSQQLIQGAAKQAVGGELNKALDGIFKPR